VKFLATGSSWTGGPAFRFSPRFLLNTDQICCWEHSRATLFSPAWMPLWLTGITEHPNGEGKLYLCAFKDVYSGSSATQWTPG
jgi:hypothetical protein